MRKCLLLFIFTRFFKVVFVQFSDNFMEGSFTNNTVWISEVNRFNTNATLLHHLSDTINGESYLSTECKVAFNAVWEFDVTLFDTSTSNYAKVYLMSDNSDLTSNLNGVFDSEGVRVNQLINNKMIGNKGSKIWEGTSENGAQLKTGMYIVFMQVFSEDGEVESYKKVVVLHN